MIITRNITVRVTIQIPDSDENPEESANDVLDDCNYSFAASEYHQTHGCQIVYTEITSYGET